MLWPALDLTHTFLVAFLALAIERITGYPALVHKKIGHPVEWTGRLVSSLDRRFNRPDGNPAWNRFRGGLSVVITLTVTGTIAALLAGLARQMPYGAAIEAVLAVPLLAQKELKLAVRRVAHALEENIPQARTAVSHIVGRDTSSLDGPSIARAALESLSENTSDAVVAPALWLALLGLPGIAIYKAINTLDSMTGYRNTRYKTFGWAAARLDDLVNLPASRLTGLLITGAASLTSPSAAARGLETIWRDAKKHVSPNAGWPEAAFAGVLDIALGGPRQYNDRIVDLAWIGTGRTRLEASDINRALRLYAQTITLLTILAFFCWLFV